MPIQVTRSTRESRNLQPIDLDLSAFRDAKPGKHVFRVPNLADVDNIPGQLFVVAFSDGYTSEEAQATAAVQSIMEYFPDLGKFMRRLALPDWVDILNAWREASKPGLVVDPKESSSSTST